MNNDNQMLEMLERFRREIEMRDSLIGELTVENQRLVERNKILRESNEEITEFNNKKAYSCDLALHRMAAELNQMRKERDEALALLEQCGLK